MVEKKSLLDNFALKMTQWVGTPQSLVLHTLCFVLSFIAIPFIGIQTVLLGLTTAVSLEAIYLSLFIQITVNRQHHELKGVRSDVNEILEDTEELTEETAE